MVDKIKEFIKSCDLYFASKSGELSEFELSTKRGILLVDMFIKDLESKGLKLDLRQVPILYLDLVNEYIAYRKISLKKPIKTQRALDNFVTKLYQLSDGNISIAQQIVKNTMDREWIDVFPIKPVTTNNVPENAIDKAIRMNSQVSNIKIKYDENGNFAT